jgi:hypothetical protein
LFEGEERLRRNLVEMIRLDPKWWLSASRDHVRSGAIRMTGQVLGRRFVGKMESVGITVPTEVLWAADLPNRSNRMQNGKATQQWDALAA